jgi:hypothetical protein
MRDDLLIQTDYSVGLLSRKRTLPEVMMDSSQERQHSDAVQVWPGCFAAKPINSNDS